MTFANAIKVTGGVDGRRFGVTMDIGCCSSILDHRWVQRNRHVFFYPNSPVQLLEFDRDSPALGVLLGDSSAAAMYLLRNVPLQLGEGIYPVNFLVMPESKLEVTLGLDFVDTYAVRVSTKAYGVPGTGPQLYIPTPRSYCSPAVQRDWPAGCTFYHYKVPGQFSLQVERYSAVPVSPAVMSA
jgi:hypothetical protein